MIPAGWTAHDTGNGGYTETPVEHSAHAHKDLNDGQD